MRHLRWKQKFISGFSRLDHTKQQLYQELQTLQTEMTQKEHCQDMRVLMDELNQQALNLFQLKAPNLLQNQVAEIGQTLDRHLPLAALDTPACRACALCDHTDVSLHGWLEATKTSDEDEQECAA